MEKVYGRGAKLSGAGLCSHLRSSTTLFITRITGSQYLSATIYRQFAHRSRGDSGFVHTEDSLRVARLRLPGLDISVLLLIAGLF